MSTKLLEIGDWIDRQGPLLATLEDPKAAEDQKAAAAKELLWQSLVFFRHGQLGSCTYAQLEQERILKLVAEAGLLLTEVVPDEKERELLLRLGEPSNPQHLEIFQRVCNELKEPGRLSKLIRSADAVRQARQADAQYHGWTGVGTF
ncbi:MAG: hypothetical protein AAB358_01610 [Patescibacteria group bacterium]